MHDFSPAAEVSESLRILYGGSVTAANCKELGACQGKLAYNYLTQTTFFIV